MQVSGQIIMDPSSVELFGDPKYHILSKTIYAPPHEATIFTLWRHFALADFEHYSLTRLRVRIISEETAKELAPRCYCAKNTLLALGIDPATHNPPTPLLLRRICGTQNENGKKT